MRRIYGLLLLVSLAAFSACKSDKTPPPQPAPEGDIALTGTIAAANQVLTGPGCPFNLFAREVQATGWGNLQINGAAAYHSHTDNSITVAHKWPADGRRLHFIGVMNAGDVGESGSASCSVQVNPEGLIHLNAGEGYEYDYLLSNNLLAGKNDASAQMEFRHVMTQLVVKLNVATDIATTCNVTGNIHASKTTGTYSVLTTDLETCADCGTEDHIIPYAGTGQSTDPNRPNTVKIYHLVPDGSTITKMTDVKINDIEVGTISFYDTNDQAAGVVLKPGVSYTLTLQITNTDLNNAIISMDGWRNQTIGSGTQVQTGKRLNVTWDPYGADVTAVELVGNDNTKFAANVTKTDAGKGYAEGVKDMSLNVVKAYGYHGDVAVEMTNPKDGTSQLWSYDPATNTIDLQRVLVATSAQVTNIEREPTAGIGKHYFQVCDIDMASISSQFYPIGTWTPFEGSYVGGGFRITNLNYTYSWDCSGLFALNNGGLIRDVYLTGTIEGEGLTAGICSENMNGGRIENCTSEMQLTTAWYSGGVVGVNRPGCVVSNCTFRGSITNKPSTYFLGGVVGQNEGTVTKCTNYGKISSDNTVIGGIAGENIGDATLTDCVNRGEVSSTVSFLGGIAGQNKNNAVISGCVNYAKVETTYPSSGDDQSLVGGICGYNEVAVSNRQLFGCENRGAVIGKGIRVGGIVGYSNYGLADCTNYGAVTGRATVGGIAGDVQAAARTAGNVITNCHNRGVVTGTGDFYDFDYFYGPIGGRQTAGITGASYNIGLEGCSNHAEISGYDRTGGIVGYLHADMTDCHNYNSVSGRRGTGGLAGIVMCNTNNYADRFTVSGCTNQGKVTSHIKHSVSAGGICGVASGAILTDCHNKAPISGVSAVGGITGRADQSQNYTNAYCLFQDCTNSASISIGGDATGDYPKRDAGGIVGHFGSGSIISCRNEATGVVDIDVDYAGGIAGYSGGRLIDSHNKAMVKTTGSHAGGIAGNIHIPNRNSVDEVPLGDGDIAVYRCSNTGAVTAGGNFAGGISGGGHSYDASITNEGGSPIVSCFNTGSVSGTDYVGGVAGSLTNRDMSFHRLFNHITACYNTGAVTGTGNNVGGVCGQVYSYFFWDYEEMDYRVQACYNTGVVTGATNVAGVVGELFTDGWNQAKPMVVKDCFWANNPSLPDVASTDADEYTVQDNYQFTAQWPVDDPSKNWGVGNDPANGKHWKNLGSSGSSYPKLWWE